MFKHLVFKYLFRGLENLEFRGLTEMPIKL